MSPSGWIIAVDWGTSTLRTYLLDESGTINGETISKRGILKVSDKRFEDVLVDEVAQLGVVTRCPIICSGMITSRQGWVETPYLGCPAEISDLAAEMVVRDTARLGPIYFIPGVMQHSPEPDIMRGEETQVAGLDQDDGLCLLPGTHSKWVNLEDGRIRGFTTYMTGDLYGALIAETILRALPDEPWSTDDFLAGIRRGHEEHRQGVSLLASLFRSRARNILGLERSAGSRSYLSGLLIGAEIGNACSIYAPTRPVTVIGDEPLTTHYLEGLAELGVTSRVAPARCAPRGIFQIALIKGLILLPEA